MTGYALGQPYGYGLTEQSTLPVTQPAAGQPASFRLLRHDKWRLIACVFDLTTDATAGNRYVTIEYPAQTPTSSWADGAAVQVTPSSTNQRFVGSLNRGNSEWNAPSDVFFPLSGMWLEAGRTITINVTNMGAADQLSKIYFTFDRLPSIDLLPADSDV